MAIESRPRVLVVVVTYNSASCISQCLDAVSSELADVVTVVFDNDSFDDSVKVAKSHLLKPLIRISESNIGFSRAVNISAGISDFDFLLLLNPDAMMDSGALDALITAAKQFPQDGIFGGLSRYPSGATFPCSVLTRHDLCHALKFALLLNKIPFMQSLHPDVPPGGLPSGTLRVPAIAGSLMLIRRVVWDALGGLDEAFFLYGEDVDFCMRAEMQGYTCVFTDTCTYLHLMGASSNSEASRMVRILSGRMRLYRRYAKGCLGVALLTYGVAVRALLETLCRREGIWRSCWQNRREWLKMELSV